MCEQKFPLQLQIHFTYFVFPKSNLLRSLRLCLRQQTRNLLNRARVHLAQIMNSLPSNGKHLMMSNCRFSLPRQWTPAIYLKGKLASEKEGKSLRAKLRAQKVRNFPSPSRKCSFVADFPLLLDVTPWLWCWLHGLFCSLLAKVSFTPQLSEWSSKPTWTESFTSLHWKLSQLSNPTMKDVRFHLDDDIASETEERVEFSEFRKVWASLARFLLKEFHRSSSSSDGILFISMKYLRFFQQVNNQNNPC